MSETNPPQSDPNSSKSSSQKGRSSSSSKSSSKRGGRKVRVASPEESQLEQHELTKHQSQRKKRKRGGGGGDVGQLNLTSMIDVIFLLLIYFVITANFVEDEGVLVAKMPRGTGEADPDEPPPEKIDIRLKSVDQTDVLIDVHNKRFRSFTQLANYLESIQSNPEEGRTGSFPPDNPIVIHPRAQVRWQHVVQAFNATVKTDWTKVSFAQASGGG